MMCLPVAPKVRDGGLARGREIAPLGGSCTPVPLPPAPHFDHDCETPRVWCSVCPSLEGLVRYKTHPTATAICFVCLCCVFWGSRFWIGSTNDQRYHGRQLNLRRRWTSKSSVSCRHHERQGKTCNTVEQCNVMGTDTSTFT